MDLDPGIVSVVASVLALAGTLALALASVKNARKQAASDDRSAQMQASDEIASGSKTLLEEYRIEVNKLRNELIYVTIETNKLKNVKREVEELKEWRQDVIDFLILLLGGSKANEQQLIDAHLEPVFTTPDMPEWLEE